MLDNSFKENHQKPIPIGHQEYGYQCEDVFFDFTKMHEKVLIDGYKPSRRGSLPYPNDEINEIEKYQLELKRNYNSIEITLKKIYKDGRIGFCINNISFSQFVNRIFEGNSATSWIRDAPKSTFKSS